MAGIRCESLRKVFGHVEALRSVSLEVRDQEFTVLLGPSGCGKTTLLRIIAGLETETAGDVYIGERRVNGLPPRRREIAMVFQNYAVFPHMTVFENIAFGLRMKKMRDDEIRPRVERAAAMMHIEQLLERYSGQLSGGQRQRVAVSRALAVEPQVLLMDEPLSNLDALLRLEMRAELKSLLQDSRTTTIYVTHDQVEAMSLADRIAVMWQRRDRAVRRPDQGLSGARDDLRRRLHRQPADELSRPAGSSAAMARWPPAWAMPGSRRPRRSSSGSASGSGRRISRWCRPAPARARSRARSWWSSRSARTCS